MRNDINSSENYRFYRAFRLAHNITLEASKDSTTIDELANKLYSISRVFWDKSELSYAAAEAFEEFDVDASERQYTASRVYEELSYEFENIAMAIDRLYMEYITYPFNSKYAANLARMS